MGRRLRSAGSRPAPPKPSGKVFDTMAKRGHDALSFYHSTVRNYPVLTREAELDLARRWRDDRDERAAETLVLSNMRAVIKISSEFVNQHASLADLVQEGNLGLLKAVDRFDPDRGTRFLSYAAWWIRAYIRDYMLRTRSLVRLGTTQNQRTVYSRLGKARTVVAREGLDGEARLKRLEEVIGVDRKTILSMQGRLAGYDVSLDAPLGADDDSASRGSLLPDDTPGPEQQVAEAEHLSRSTGELAMALAQLPDRERRIIEERHLSVQLRTLQEVGEELGISRERVRQLEARAMRRMRSWILAERGLH